MPLDLDILALFQAEPHTVKEVGWMKFSQLVIALGLKTDLGL